MPETKEEEKVGREDSFSLDDDAKIEQENEIRLEAAEEFYKNSLKDFRSLLVIAKAAYPENAVEYIQNSIGKVTLIIQGGYSHYITTIGDYQKAGASAKARIKNFHNMFNPKPSAKEIDAAREAQYLRRMDSKVKTMISNEVRTESRNVFVYGRNRGGTSSYGINRSAWPKIRSRYHNKNVSELGINITTMQYQTDSGERITRPLVGSESIRLYVTASSASTKNAFCIGGHIYNGDVDTYVPVFVLHFLFAKEA